MHFACSVLIDNDEEPQPWQLLESVPSQILGDSVPQHLGDFQPPQSHVEVMPWWMKHMEGPAKIGFEISMGSNNH